MENIDYVDARQNETWALDTKDVPTETVYIPGNGADFVVFIQAQKERAQIKSIDGHARWIITRDDGTQYIARPIEAQ